MEWMLCVRAHKPVIETAYKIGEAQSLPRSSLFFVRILGGFLLRNVHPRTRCMGAIWKPAGDVESLPDVVNQNYHFEQDPQVIPMDVNIWETPNILCSCFTDVWIWLALSYVWPGTLIAPNFFLCWQHGSSL